jgi:hypothetical protein
MVIIGMTLPLGLDSIKYAIVICLIQYVVNQIAHSCSETSSYEINKSLWKQDTGKAKSKAKSLMLITLLLSLVPVLMILMKPEIMVSAFKLSPIAQHHAVLNLLSMFMIISSLSKTLHAIL